MISISRKKFLIGLCALSLSACQPSSQTEPKFKAKDTLDVQKLTSTSEDVNAMKLAEQHYQRGMKAFNDKDYLKAKQHFLMAADEQHPVSLAALGDIARLGLVNEGDKKKASQWYEKALNTKDPQVQYHIANIIIKGEWQSNLNPAILLEQAAENKNTKAQVLLAKLYQKGQWVTQSDKQAFKWYLAACEKEPEAMTAMGLAFFKGDFGVEKNEALGIKFLKQASDMDYYPAQYAMASLFVDGYNVQADRFVVLDYLQKAAKNNQTDAQIKLARALIQFSIPEYDKSAFYWLNKASAANSDEALFWLATCYYDGIGTEIDYEKAHDIYLTLGQNYYQDAYLKLGLMYHQGQGVPQDNQIARTWFLRAANAGVKDAQKYVAELYRESMEEGEDTPENAENFNTWLQAVSENDNDIVYLKAVNHLYGRNQFEQNTALGMQLLEQAAYNGSILAQRELGKIYQQGTFGLEDAKSAYQWYLMAAKGGDPFAQIHLARQFLTGEGVEQDLVQAYAWANLAALKENQDAIALRDEITQKLSSEDIKAAQILSNQFFLDMQTQQQEMSLSRN